MNEITAGFADGFTGAFKLAAMIVVGVAIGTYRLFVRIGKDFMR